MRWIGCDELTGGGRSSPNSGVSACGRRSTPKQLQQVVRQADEIPFTLHLREAAKQELLQLTPRSYLGNAIVQAEAI